MPVVEDASNNLDPAPRIARAAGHEALAAADGQTGVAQLSLPADHALAQE